MSEITTDTIVGVYSLMQKDEDGSFGQVIDSNKNRVQLQLTAGVSMAMPRSMLPGTGLIKMKSKVYFGPDGAVLKVVNVAQPIPVQRTSGLGVGSTTPRQQAF